MQKNGCYGVCNQYWVNPVACQSNVRTITQAHTATEKVCKITFASKRLNIQQNSYVLWLPSWGRREWHEVNDKDADGHMPSYRLSGKCAYMSAEMSSLHREKREEEIEKHFFNPSVS